MGHKLEQNKIVNSRTDFFYYMFRNILLFSIPLLIISGLVLSHLSLHSSATGDDSSITSSGDHLDFSIPVACTLSSNVEVSHSAVLLNGTYKDNIGKTILTTYCNDKNGYTVYASAMSRNNSGQSVLASATGSTDDIITGLYDSGDTSAWAMKLSTSNINTNIDNNGDTITTNNIITNQNGDTPTIEPPFLNYTTVPSQYTKVVSKSNGTVSSKTGSSFTTTYAVYVSPTQSAGNYTGLVRYILLHDNSSIPTPTYFMQDAAFWKDDLTTGQSIQAIDERDGKKYWVTKLADGNIWMTQNLDLCIGCEGVAALTSENTDISTDPNITGKGIYASTSTGGYSESGGVWTWTPASTAITSSRIVNYGNNTVSNWNQNNTTPASAEGGDTYFYTSGNNSNDKRYDSLELCKKDHTEADCLHYHAGNYYNYTAAIASNESSGISANTAIAGNSICPRGWRLPYASTTDNSYNEFGRLFYGYNITNNLANGTSSVGYKSGGLNALRTSPLWFVRSGNVDNGTLNKPAVDGYYWPSTVASSTNAYSFVFYGSNIVPAHSNGRFNGRSIRCIAR